MAVPDHQTASPAAHITHVALSDLSPDRALARITLRIANPSPVPLSIRHARWLLTADQHLFATGSADVACSVDPLGEASVTVTAPLILAEVLAACPAAEPGAIVPYTARIELVADPSDNGHAPLVAVAQAELPIPAPPVVELDAIRFDSVDWSRADARLELVITNRCPFDLDLNTLELRLTLGSTVVISHVHRTPACPIAFAPAGRRRISVPISLSPANMGFAAFRTLQLPDADYHLAAIAYCDSAHGPLIWTVDHHAHTTLATTGAAR